MSQSTEFVGGKLQLELQDGIARVTINQPEKRNAMSIEMWSGLEEILQSAEKDESIRVLILKGAGDKAFVSGADISQFEKLRSNADAQREYDRVTKSGLARLVDSPKPIIAQIRGFCFGGGIAMAISADLRIASEDAQFSIPAARLGASYGFERIRSLVSLIGHANARRMLYTGDRLDSAEALRIGLIHRVVPNDVLDDEIAALALIISANAPLSIRASKLAIDHVLRDPADRDLRSVADATDACYDSDDYREGRTAFMEKRSPNFHGR
jgi:enoyl-CoA hydratase